MNGQIVFRLDLKKVRESVKDGCVTVREYIEREKAEKAARGTV